MEDCIQQWFDDYVTGHEAFRRALRYKLSKVKIVDSCWVWPGPYGSGMYGALQICGIRTQATHLIMELQSKRPIPDSKEVCHKCDNPLCINPEHLFIGTHKENLFDAAAKGKLVHVLSQEKAEEIRALYNKGNTSERKLAKLYGVGRTTISLLLKRRTWK